ncbi:hypothetical protein LguiA_011852 [Lonicera macranthoides]
MDEKRPGNENPEAGGGGSGGERTNLDLPLPGKDLLEHVIDVLQRDKKDFSGKPVDPKEVPIDFGTIRSKVQDGIYNNLNKFESDILLILNNAMITTLPDSDYFKEVQAINDLAERVFIKLKTDPDGLKSEFPSKRSKRGWEPGDKARNSSIKPGPNCKRRVGDPNDQPQLSTEEFCEKYDMLSQVRRNPSRFSRFSTPSESTPLEQTRCMPMPGILLPTRQESQHHSAPHGQQGDIYPADWGAPQQQRQRDDAGPLVQLTHQELHHTSDPRVRPSGSNSVDQGQQSGIYAVNQGAPQRRRQFNDAGPWGRLARQEPYHTSHPGVRPGETDPVGWAEWKEYEQALTMLGQTGYMPMPSQLGILQHLSAPAIQEPLHLSAPHGQQGDIYAVDQGAPQQHRLHNNAGPLVRLKHQEPHHTSDPRVRLSRSNPEDQGVRQKHKQALTTLGQTEHMPLPAWYGIPSNLHDAPTLQEPQHLSAPHGQQGGIYAVKQGAPQQQRQFDDTGPWGQLTRQEPYLAPVPGVRRCESDPAGWTEWKMHEQAHTALEQSGYMPMPLQLGIPQHLLGVPASQEPQHLSAPHGQQGDIYAVDQGAPQQQRQCVDAVPLVQLTHQEPHSVSDPRVRPSGSNPVDQSVRQEHEQALTTLGQTGHIPTPARYGVPSKLHDAPTLQEPKHLSAPHGQQGGVFAVKQGAPQQERQFDDGGPRGRLTHQGPCHAPDPGVRPSESDPVGWAEWKEYEQALTTLGQTGYMPMKPQLGIPQHLLAAPASQEPQHPSAPHGQQGDIYAVDRGAPQQQRQRDDAGPLVRITHQEPQYTSDPRVRPSGGNPVVQGVRQEHEQALTNWSLPDDNDDGSSDEGWGIDSGTGLDDSRDVFDDEDDNKEYDGYCDQDWGTDLESDSDKPFEEWHDVFDDEDDYNHDNNNGGKIIPRVPVMVDNERVKMISVNKIQTYSALANEICMAYAYKKLEPPVSNPTILCPVPGFRVTYMSGTRTLDPDQMIFGDFKSQLGQVKLDQI